MAQERIVDTTKARAPEWILVPTLEHQSVDWLGTEVGLAHAIAGLYALKNLSRRHVWIRRLAEREDLPQHDAEAPHVGSCRKVARHDGLGRHPLDRQQQLVCRHVHLLVAVAVVVRDATQAKVTDLDQPSTILLLGQE